MKTRTSKYVGKQFDGGWVCTHMGIANVQGKRKKAPGAINHYYLFERMTTDNKAEKIIRLNSSEAAMVYRGILKVEDLANKRKSSKMPSATQKVSYHFRQD